MAADVAGLDPLTVSLRDYIDGIHDSYLQEQARERQVLQAALHSTERELGCVETRLIQRFDLNDKALQAALTAQKEAVAAALAAAREAVDKAERANEKRFDAANAFREQLADQAGTFMPRELAQTQIEDVRSVLMTLHSRLDTIQGQSKGAATTVGYFIAVAGVLISLVVVAVNVALR